MGTIIAAVNTAFYVYNWLILIRVILSWFRHNPYHPVIRFVYEITEPVLGLFRRIIPPVGVIDLSPLVALLVIEAVRAVIVRILVGLA
ncbi:MAG: YggT family protein [Firmicutes bacterium]|nr:YggT family protein [Bacillota bacterium]